MKNLVNKKYNSDLKTRHGFSLVELIVSLTLFVSITALASTSIISIVNASSQARVSGQALNVITFAIEDLVRNARLGTTYRCSDNIDFNADLSTARDCGFDSATPSAGTFIFESKEGDRSDEGFGDQYIYRWDGDEDFLKSVDGGRNFISLTPQGVKMTDFDVEIEGSGITDSIQPRAKFSFTFTYDYKGQSIPVTYETSVTSRTLDVE